MKKLLLYSRSNCHLCEAMEEELSPFIAAKCIEVKRILIDNNERFVQLYGHRVPVLMMGEQLVCEYFLDTDILQRILQDSSAV